jgi:hypothetical protein
MAEEFTPLKVTYRPEAATDGWHLYAVTSTGRDRLNARTVPEALKEIEGHYKGKQHTRAVVRITKETVWQKA